MCTNTVTLDTLSNFPSDFLSYSELIVYGACLTGTGGDGATNLVNATVAKGAQTVVGFECEVDFHKKIKEE